MVLDFFYFLRFSVKWLIWPDSYVILDVDSENCFEN